MSLFENNTEETEKERKERQAQNAAVATGLAIGATAVLIQHAYKEEINKDEPTEENQGFEQTM